MLRRLYYLFPEKFQVQEVVEQLAMHGVVKARMHTLAKEGIDISGLPPASARQTSDFGARLENWVWSSNLLVFFSASVIALLGFLFDSWLFMLLGGVIAATAFFLGYYFARKIPHVHLSEFKGALSHGEILLMVDVPLWRISEVNRVVDRKHPEVDHGGVGWAIEALHI